MTAPSAVAKGGGTTLQPTDLIFVNVVGTNGQTRTQSEVVGRFNGLGQPVDEKGEVIEGGLPLTGLPTGEAGVTVPEFPWEAYNAAAKAGNLDELKAISLGHASALQSSGNMTGSSVPQKIARSVLEYCKEAHGFHEEDGNWYVLTMADMDVAVTKLKNDQQVFSVGGTAVFGAVR